MLIPGVCGSKIMARNKKTCDVQYAWMNTAYLPFSVATKLSQHMWGCTDDDLTYKSFVEDYEDIYALPGL